MNTNQSHSVLVGYLLWILGFTGAHRFYYGKKLTGILWFFTGGLFLIGWVIDVFLIPLMHERASGKYREGDVDYSIAWLLQTFFGYLGIHRLYMGKWLTAILFFFTGGLLGVGWVYDFLTLNEQIDELNQGAILFAKRG